MKNKISVIVITKNEEKRIEKFCKSVSWADEIIIVDDCSTDKTVEIAKTFGAKTIIRSSNGKFDEQRNFGTKEAQHSWILHTDADEIVPDELKNEIIDLLNSSPKCCAYNIKRKNFFLGHFMRYGGWYEERSPKLFKKHSAQYEGNIHERLSVAGEIGELKSDIEHYPFDSISQFIERQNYYTTIVANELATKNTIPTTKEFKYNIKIRPLRLFWKFYFKKKGYKEGFYGFIFCLLFAWVHFMSWSKYWELTRTKIDH